MSAAPSERSARIVGSAAMMAVPLAPMASVATQEDHNTGLAPLCLSAAGCSAADAFICLNPNRG
jgi:hypothetical protein